MDWFDKCEKLKKRLEDLGHDIKSSVPSSVYICRNCGHGFYYSSSTADHVEWYVLNGPCLFHSDILSCDEMIIKNIIE